MVADIAGLAERRANGCSLKITPARERNRCSTVRWRTESLRQGAYRSNRCAGSRVRQRFDPSPSTKGNAVNSIVYIVGAIVIIVAILSFVGLR
jgi:hypothetical protein